jgi:hypothetical protein
MTDGKPAIESKTVIANGVVFLASALALKGYLIPLETQAALVTLILAAVNLVLRNYTNKPITSIK